MARHEALQAIVRRRQAEHLEASSRQQPLAGVSYGAGTQGIRLAADGSLDCDLELRHPDGRTEPFDWGLPDVEAALPRWRSLLQVGSRDGEMMWGDVGQLHWLVRDDAAPEDAEFTWQCG